MQLGSHCLSLAFICGLLTQSLRHDLQKDPQIHKKRFFLQV
uniref:Uncharacterized protein n=1 Tax=Anguilla anguilla TaxID=7936 RepID=A0A0E9RVH3_ANGAN